MRQSAVLCLLYGAAVWGPLASAGAPASDNPLQTVLDRAVGAESARFFDAGCHVGLSMAVVRPEGTYIYNYGATTRDGSRLADRRSLYEIASVTKTFTAALAAHAVIDKRMTLDGDFRAYLPDSYTNLAWNGDPINLRWLLTHRSGMPRDIPDTDAIYARGDFRTQPHDLIAIAEDYNRNRILSALHDVHLNSAPGEKEAYSNAGFLVIAFGLERIYGQSFPELTSRIILRPLGMTSTSFAVKRADRSRLVKGYDRYGRIMPYHLPMAGAAWGLYSSAEDLGKFVRWQLSEQNPLIDLSHQPLIGNERDGVAMAWHLGFESDQPMLWHGGGSFGMSAQVVLFPKQHDGYALLANDACQGTESALADIAVSLQGQLSLAGD